MITSRTKVLCCVMMACAALFFLPRWAKAQTEDDKQFLATAAQSDRNEIVLSELAERKATNPDVKAFAEKLVAEHQQIADDLKGFVDAWGLGSPKRPDTQHQIELDKLKGLSGEDFDREYMSQMVVDHTKELNVFMAEAKTARDTKLRAAVSKGKTTVAADKNMACGLKKKV